LLPTVCLAGCLEVLGWSARLWSSINSTRMGPFEIQITATIVAPTPLLAANFVLLGRIIRTLGPSYSRLSPKWYTIIFFTCDFVSLIVQGAGGGLAATAAGNNTNPAPGGHVMLGGIVFQMLTISVYVICATEFLVRYFKNKPIHEKSPGSSNERGNLTRGLKVMIAAMIFNTTCLFIRAVYRTIELSDGWEGRIISTQLYFNVLDAAMIILAIFTLNFCHPGFLLVTPRDSAPVSESDEKTV